MNKPSRSSEHERQQDKAAADELWAERWRRLGAANDAARRERLRALTLEEAIRQFEDLCREVHAAFDKRQVARSHPVGLVKYTRGERAVR